MYLKEKLKSIYSYYMNKKIKILIISEHYWESQIGGAELQIKYILDYLGETYSKIYTYITENNKKIYSDEIKLIKIRRRKILEIIFGQIIYFIKMMKIILKEKPDFIYHRNLTNLALPVIFFKNKSKSIIHIASEKDLCFELVYNKYFLRNLLDYYGKKLLIYKTNVIISQANYQSNLLIKKYNRKADLIIHNAHPFPKEPIYKNNDVLQIVWAANFKYEKQPELFIELSNRINIYGVNFIMIGRLPNSKYGKELLNKINNSKNLTYIGGQSIERVNMYLSESHIFVNTSLYEGFPNTFIQAWMRKVPVVSLNVDPDNVIKINNLGLHSLSFENMVNDVKKLIFDKALRKKMGDDAQKYAFQNYSLNNFEKIKSLIDREGNIDN